MSTDVDLLAKTQMLGNICSIFNLGTFQPSVVQADKTPNNVVSVCKKRHRLINKTT